MRGDYFTYRTTTDKLAEHLNSLEAEGHEVFNVAHVGGRDWLIICRKDMKR